MGEDLRRFITEDDTPCPIRLGRFGYARTGEFRAPKPGEMFILPTEGPELQEHEPLVVGACGESTTEPRHIVVPIPEEKQQMLQELGAFGLLAMILGGNEDLLP